MTEMRSDGSAPGRSPGHIEIARQDTSVLMRVVGLGNMNISLTMMDFVRQATRAGYRNFAMDLKDCDGMDSTFMGTIVGMLRDIREQHGWLCLLNVSRANHDLLDMIGVGKFVTFKDEFPVVAVETECLVSVADPKRRMLHIREAHANLIDVDQRNRERFGRFLMQLENEMKSVGLDDSLPNGNDDDPAQDDLISA